MFPLTCENWVTSYVKRYELCGHSRLILLLQIWSDFDRAPSLICGNKMPTRCNRWFLLQILLLAQHVLGTTMPIIRSSRVLYRWLLPVVFGALVFKLSVWCGAEGYVSGLRAAAHKPANLWVSANLLRGFAAAYMSCIGPLHQSKSYSAGITDQVHVLHSRGCEKENWI